MWRNPPVSNSSFPDAVAPDICQYGEVGAATGFGAGENDIETRLIASDTCYQVLVVDDIREVRLVLTKMLQRLGHTVKSADSGRQALAELNDYRADIIFSDISMPEMNGYELVQALRRRPDTCSRYVVAMTGNGEISSEQASLAAGFDAHLAKPFRFDAVRQLLAEANLTTVWTRLH